MGSGLDPGPCPICGTAHCGCGVPTVVRQLPQRDAAADGIRLDDAPPAAAPPTLADLARADLAPGAFTTDLYRGTKKKR